MIFYKKIHNNMALAYENEIEYIVMGKGIGFHYKNSEEINTKIIEKKFILQNEYSKSDLDSLLGHINKEDFDLANDIMNLFNHDHPKNKLREEIIIPLADHLSFAIKRAKTGISFRTPLEWELKQVYSKEYQTAEKAIRLIQEKTGVNIPEQEAAFITLHFVNSITENKGFNETILVSKIIQNILNIIKYYYHREFDNNSIYFERFITHIRYFVKRQIIHQFPTNESTSFLDIVKIKYENDYICALKISDFLKETYNWNLSEDELLYLTIHLNRLSTNN